VWLLLGLCALLAVASVVPSTIFVLAVAAGVLAAFVAADVQLGPSAGSVQFSRWHEPHATLGRPTFLVYTIDNPCASSLRLDIVEAPAARVIFPEDMTRVTVAARSRGTFRREFIGIERGIATFTASYARVRNHVGLLERRFVAPSRLEVRIYPDFSAVEGYGFLARRSTLLETGLRKLRLRGIGTEFESLRDYEAGDAFRSIDWKASARRGRLMVTQYDVERSQTILIAVDAGRLMTPHIEGKRKFDYALTAALSAARVAQIAGDNVGFIAFAARTLLHVAPRRGLAHHAALVRAAYALQPNLEEPDYEEFAADVRRRYAKRSLIVVFTDLFDPAASAMVLSGLAVLSPRHLVLCVLMNDASIARALAREPRDARDAYRVATALALEGERREAIAKLRACGVIVVDAPAQRLTVALLDAYLDVKARGRL
jgi:uncharacterized protein (DUF58 family)